ncbi:GTPase-associated protein 1-related protein [Actinomadura vinacea]|uniref:GTPase-associated protein 1-related protein n=1 Tax=Actinomadura vinacea TaxID=115336 RepID=A0ABN3IZI9_9ACTN
MAWQLHYTSARRGPTGRAGFQFVAETPGLPEGARAGVTPYLSYRPPPGAPLSPDDAELDRFPVAMLYDRVAGRPLLLRCRYLGRDYSGRYGNFFAHAVVAEEEELEGLRPAELWRAPLWTDRPVDGDAAGVSLPALDELSPGADSDPESLAEWLAAHGAAGGDGDGAYALLARLMDAVVDVLAQGHGRVVLVGGEVEPIARWIAVVSYSLPVAAAARMSFVTYSADPDGAAQRLVGTTPDVWASAQRNAGHAFHVGGVPGAPPARPAGAASRFARTVAACWRDFDFAGLDALGELGELAPPGARAAPEVLDQAAALLSLCRGDRTVTPEEEAAVAGLLARRDGEIPDWVWRDLARGTAELGLDLALTVHGRTGSAEPAGAPGDAEHAKDAEDPAPGPAITTALAGALAEAPDLSEVARIVAAASKAGVEVGADEARTAAERCARSGAADLPAALPRVPAGLRGPLLDGVLAGLAGGGREARRAVLTGAACDLLYGDLDRLRDVPEIAMSVLVSVGGRRPELRVAVTGELLGLAAASPEAAGSTDRALDRVWRTPPSPDDCLALLEAHADAFTAYEVLAGLPARAFARLAHDDGGAPGDREGARAEMLSAPATLRLAARVRATLPEGTGPARAAAAIQAYTGAVTAERPEPAADALVSLTESGAPARLSEDLFSAAARRLTRRGPGFRAALLAGLDGPGRSRLGALWTAALPGRARSGRAPVRGAEIAERNELIEVVLRLRRRGVAEPALETWARSAAGRWLAARQLDTHFAGDRELRTALKELVAEARGRGD